MAKKTIIIGGGIGGLAVAARLLKQGHQVTIVEKNHFLGGKVSSVDCQGYQFDGGATLVMLPQDYLELFQELGTEAEHYIKMQQLENNYKVFYPNKAPVVYSGQLNEVINQLEAKSPKLSHGYLDYLADTYGKYIFMEKYILDQNFTGRYELFKPKNMKVMWRLRPLLNVDQYLKSYIHDEDFLNFLAFQAMYLGISPSQGANVVSMIPAMTQMYGLWYIDGGMNGLIHGLEKLIYDLGGEILLDTAAEEIVMAGQRAIGIKTAQQVLLADNIVCNADYTYSLEKLLPKGAVQAEGFEPEDAQYSCSTFMLYLVCDNKYPQLEVHNILLNEHFKKGIQAPFQGKSSRKPSLYVYCPSRIDPARVPEGHEMISVTVRVPNLKAHPCQWTEKQKNRMIKNILRMLETHLGLEDIQQHVICAQCRTPQHMLQGFNCYEGASFGLAPLRQQSGMYRPSVKARHIDGLYFVGDSVQPGAGVSLVLKSAKLASALIAKEVFNDEFAIEHGQSKASTPFTVNGSPAQYAADRG